MISLFGSIQVVYGRKLISKMKCEFRFNLPLWRPHTAGSAAQYAGSITYSGTVNYLQKQCYKADPGKIELSLPRPDPPSTTASLIRNVILSDRR